MLAEHADAPWLPQGGRAQVVRGGRPRSPMCLVRLLLRRVDRVFCVPRDGTGKLDLPTRPVVLDDPDGAATVADLVLEVTGATHEARFLGAVRNIVDAADDDYPWPSPLAHFGVWIADAEPCVPGHWLSVEELGSPLRDRHWFPLVQGHGAESR
ncbi:NUDIX hydrolase [Curtobacterium sp. MCPF17_046]|nr:NUDIX hydrolase [Curtobacterium sp. MCPF17_046]